MNSASIYRPQIPKLFLFLPRKSLFSYDSSKDLRYELKVRVSVANSQLNRQVVELHEQEKHKKKKLYVL
jgi:hypothetical protein